ncbi:MAG: hypothetical protein ABF532_09520 [Bifidobacterium sp.]|uniref:hypothetical protein n=1 Tax=Bifidobacterium sp. TaxID=41200 RepID=UPI0039EC4A34
MSKKKMVQDALVPDEITPVMLLQLSKKASSLKDCAAAFRVSVSRMLTSRSKEEYIAKYKNIDAITEALYDADDLAQLIIDAGFAIETMLVKPSKSRELIMFGDLRRSLDSFEGWHLSVERPEGKGGDAGDSAGDTDDGDESVDPDTGEITGKDE